jgi:hypothetical protein
MKKNILLVFTLFISFASNAQKKDAIKDFFWGKNDKHDKSTTIPEKYKNESAVILYKNENYDYHKFGKSVTYTTSVRKRIKLLDQVAVTEFSEFSFKERFYSNKGYSGSKGTITLGIKIVKPDGKEIEIDINKEAIKEDDSKKVAISNLEIGDIIDFYYHSEEPFKSIYEFGFDPIETTLGETYPILDLKIAFETENDFFVNFNSYNGAPELKRISSDKSSDRKYELIATDIPKNDFPRWFLPLAELPCYKFQVFFARSGKFEQRADAFLSKKESEIKKTVSKEDVFEYYDSKFYPYGDLKDVNEFLKGKKFDSTEEKIKEIYYFTRHQFFTRYIEAYVISEAQIIPFPYSLYDNPVFFNSEEQFIRYFMQYLKKNEIDFEIIIATGKENGPIEDILIQRNARVLLKINTENPIYFSTFSPFSMPNQFDSELEGTNAYTLKVAKSKKVTDIAETKLPSTSHEDNKSTNIMNVNLDIASNSLVITKESLLYGHNKDFEYSKRLKFYDYIDEDYKKFGTTPLLDLVRNKKDKARYKKEYDAFLQKLKDNQNEYLKDLIKKEYEVSTIEDYSIQIVNTGRFGEESPLAFNETFKIKDSFIKKSGNNYIIEIGKLIDSQVEIQEKEHKRSNNVYISFPKSFEYIIKFQVPDGYTLNGTDKLVKKVSNETGSFESKFEIKDNMLTITAVKQYFNVFEPAKNWPKMIDFLDAAYQLTQEKILLKKN